MATDVPGGVWANIGPILNFLDANATAVGTKNPQYTTKKFPARLDFDIGERDPPKTERKSHHEHS
jgi:hypothetical protein